MNWWAQYSTWSFPDTLVKTVPFLFCVSFFFISSDLAHRAPITTPVAGRLFAPDRDSCVLASFCGLPPGLASMKHFAILSSNTYEYSRGVFFHLGIHSFPASFSSTRANFGLYEANKLYFYPSAGGSKTIDKKTKQKNDSRHGHKARTLHLAA